MLGVLVLKILLSIAVFPMVAPIKYHFVTLCFIFPSYISVLISQFIINNPSTIGTSCTPSTFLISHRSSTSQFCKGLLLRLRKSPISTTSIFSTNLPEQESQFSGITSRDLDDKVSEFSNFLLAGQQTKPKLKLIKKLVFKIPQNAASGEPPSVADLYHKITEITSKIKCTDNKIREIFSNCQNAGKDSPKQLVLVGPWQQARVLRLLSFSKFRKTPVLPADVKIFDISLKSSKSSKVGPSSMAVGGNVCYISKTKTFRENARLGKFDFGGKKEFLENFFQNLQLGNFSETSHSIIVFDNIFFENSTDISKLLDYLMTKAAHGSYLIFTSYNSSSIRSSSVSSIIGLGAVPQAGWIVVSACQGWLTMFKGYREEFQDLWRDF